MWPDYLKSEINFVWISDYFYSPQVKSSPSGYQAHSSDFGCHSKSELFKKPVIHRELNFCYFYRPRTFMCWTSWRPSDMFKRRPRGPTMTGYCIYINSNNLNIVGIWNLTFKIWKHLKYGIVEDCISNGLVFKKVGLSYGPNHSRFGHFRPDFKLLLTKWWIFKNGQYSDPH